MGLIPLVRKPRRVHHISEGISISRQPLPPRHAACFVLPGQSWLPSRAAPLRLPSLTNPTKWTFSAAKLLLQQNARRGERSTRTPLPASSLPPTQPAPQAGLPPLGCAVFPLHLLPACQLDLAQALWSLQHLPRVETDPNIMQKNSPRSEKSLCLQSNRWESKASHWACYLPHHHQGWLLLS